MLRRREESVGEGTAQMKGERRHELETNVLADWLSGVIRAIKPYVNATLSVVLLLAVATVAYTWWGRESALKSARAWGDFYQAVSAQNTKLLEGIVEDYPGTDVAYWAAVATGDLHLSRGCNLLFLDDGRAEAYQDLRKAVDYYGQVLDGCRIAELRERATFGLARALESQEDLQGAIQQYQDVENNWPDGVFAAAARQRREDLNSPATKKFYDRFAAYRKRPRAPDKPARQTPSFLDRDLGDEGSVFDLPLVPTLEETGAGEPAPKGDQSSDGLEFPRMPEPSGPTDSEAEPDSTEPDSTEPVAKPAPKAADTEGKPAGAPKAATGKTGPKPAEAQPDESKPAGNKPAENEPAGNQSPPAQPDPKKDANGSPDQGAAKE